MAFIDGLSLSRVGSRRSKAAIKVAFPEYSSEGRIAEQTTDPLAAKSHPVAGIITKEKVARLRTDLELMTAFQAGEEEAFADLYERYQARLFNFCLRMMANNEAHAADAFQETFIKIYQRAEQFRSGTNVIGWMLMVARNTCLNMLRAQRPNDSLDNHQSLVSQDRSMDPEFGHEQKFLKEILERAIAQLPVEIREPLILREFDGLSYNEIAEQLHITLGATKQRIYRAKQTLRKELWPYIKEEVAAGTLTAEDGLSFFGKEDSND